MEQILNVFSPLVLLGVGIGLIALEGILVSFVIIWFGVGLVLVGLISYFYDFSDGFNQLVLASAFALLLLFVLRKKFLTKFLESKEGEIEENFLNTKGEGIIKNGLVQFRGTYFEIDSDETFEENEKVEVLSTHKNSAKIEKK